MGYSKGIACYIDILGTKDKKFDELLRVNRIFHNELEYFQKPYSIEEYIWENNVTSFSDCAYIVYTIKDKINFNKLNIKDVLDNIFYCLYDIAYIIANFAFNGFLCRGGICYGDIYFEKSNILFGPAINNAYLLETVAKMPRVILDDEFVKKYLYVFENDLGKNEIEKMINIVLKDDIDSRYYLNYLSITTYGNYEYSKSDKYSHNIFDELYEKIKINFEKTIRDISNHDIIAKHNWNKKYFELAKKYNESLKCKQ